MAEYNPSKIIKDGNTYNFRDTTKIPLAGSNEISGSLIPSTDGTVNLGSPSYQWNNAYIKSLTINGVACGDILTHNASEFVNVTGNQTIGGIKIFKDTIIRNVGNFTAGVAPTAQTTCLILKHTNNDSTQNANSILSYMFTTGESMCELTQNPCIGSTARTWFRTNTDGSYSIYSYTKNGSLGTSGYRWKDVQTEKINNLNPGALSLPNISSTGANAWIALDTTDWVKNAATSSAQRYTPPADGWLNIRVNNAIMLGLAITGSGANYMHQMIRSETPNGLALLMPVFKNVEVAILVAGNENLTYDRSTFYYCQGNV